MESKERKASFSTSMLITALLFGGVALVIVLAELIIPIPGTGVVTDPREIFTTFGAAVTGPLGGIIVGVLAGIGEAFIGDPQSRIPLASLLAHVSGGLWLGFAYKRLAYERLEMPLRLLGWTGLVLIFYYVFAVPGFIIGQLSFYPDLYIEFYGEGASFAQAYAILGKGALPEALFTSVITSLVFVALPRKYRRPLW
jgi:hypothetical protein